MITRSTQENLYLQRIHAVIGHVCENLSEDLSLEALARVAGFSPFHFHRLFKSITEETVNEMVVRLRLERDEFEVNIRSLPEQRLAFIRVYDSYSRFSRVTSAYYRLIEWYCQKGGDLEDTTLYGTSQDDTEVTPLRLCHFDWCLRVPDDW
jgi:AraC-like DNA-binding protein